MRGGLRSDWVLVVQGLGRATVQLAVELRLRQRSGGRNDQEGSRAKLNSYRPHRWTLLSGSWHFHTGQRGVNGGQAGNYKQIPAIPR